MYFVTHRRLWMDSGPLREVQYALKYWLTIDSIFLEIFLKDSQVHLLDVFMEGTMNLNDQIK